MHFSDDSGFNLLLDFDEYFEIVIITLCHQDLKYPGKLLEAELEMQTFSGRSLLLI